MRDWNSTSHAREKHATCIVQGTRYHPDETRVGFAVLAPRLETLSLSARGISTRLHVYILS